MQKSLTKFYACLGLQGKWQDARPATQEQGARPGCAEPRTRAHRHQAPRDTRESEDPNSSQEQLPLERGPMELNPAEHQEFSPRYLLLGGFEDTLIQTVAQLRSLLEGKTR